MDILRKYGEGYVIYETSNKSYLKFDKEQAKLVNYYLNPIDRNCKDNQPAVAREIKEKVDKYFNFFCDGRIEFKGQLLNETIGNAQAPPLKAFVDLTNACNARCIHCFTNSGEELENEMNTEEINNLISELRNIGIMQVSLGGGEPLLRKDLSEILYQLKENDIAVSITTNGSLLLEDIIKILLETDLKSITISIDSLDSKISNKIRKGLILEKIINNIKNLIKTKIENNSKIEVSVRTSVNKYNRNEVICIYHYCNELGVDTLKINNTHNYGRARQHKNILLYGNEFPKLLLELMELKNNGKCRIEMPSEKYFADDNHKKLIGCTATKSFINIMSNGDVMPCAFSEGELKLGNIKNISLREILSNTLPFNMDNFKCNNCLANTYKDKKITTSPRYLV